MLFPGPGPAPTNSTKSKHRVFFSYLRSFLVSNRDTDG